MRGMFTVLVLFVACIVMNGCNRPADAADASVLTVMAKKAAVVQPDQAKPDQTAPDQVKAKKAKPDQAKAKKVKPDQAKPDQVKPDQVKPDQVKPDQVKPLVPVLTVICHAKRIIKCRRKCCR